MYDIWREDGEASQSNKTRLKEYFSAGLTLRDTDRSGQSWMETSVRKKGTSS